MNGWNEAQGGDGAVPSEPITPDEFDAMLERHQQVLERFGGK